MSATTVNLALVCGVAYILKFSVSAFTSVYVSQLDIKKRRAGFTSFFF